MRTRLVLVVLVAGFLALPAKPASAAHLITLWTQGSAFAGGLGDPCTSQDPHKPCPPNPTTTPTTAPDGLPFTYVSPGGNTRNFGWSTAVCLEASVHTTGGKAPANVGLCGMATAGVVTGFCTIATGSGDGFFYVSDPLVTTFQYYTFSWAMTLTGVAGNQFVMQVTGVVTKQATGETGSIRGVVHMQLLSGDCLNKSAGSWSTSGEFVVRIGI